MMLLKRMMSLKCVIWQIRLYLLNYFGFAESSNVGCGDSWKRSFTHCRWSSLSLKVQLRRVRVFFIMVFSTTESKQQLRTQLTLLEFARTLPAFCCQASASADS